MTNEWIQILAEQVRKGSLLTKTEQLQVLSSLLRANRMLIQAKKLGFNPLDRSEDGTQPFDEQPNSCSRPVSGHMSVAAE